MIVALILLMVGLVIFGALFQSFEALVKALRGKGPWSPVAFYFFKWLFTISIYPGIMALVYLFYLVLGHLPVWPGQAVDPHGLSRWVAAVALYLAWLRGLSLARENFRTSYLD